MKLLNLEQVDILRHSEYHQFHLGFLLQNKSYINHIWNTFVDIEYRPQLLRLDYMANPYNWFKDMPCTIDGFIVENSWDVLRGDSNEENEKWLIGVIKTKLDENFYVKIIGDAYYIPSKIEYQKRHVTRGMYILGHDEDSFIILDSSKAEYPKLVHISFNLFKKFIRKNEYIGSKYRCEVDFYKTKMEIDHSLDINTIKTNLEKYLTCAEDTEIKTGHHALECATLDVQFEEKDEGVVFFLLDYRDLMYKRMVMLSQYIQIDDILERYEKIVSEWKRIFGTQDINNQGWTTLLQTEKVIMRDLFDKL